MRVQRLPSAECLGGRAREVTLMMILEDLAAAPAFDALPSSVGPLVVMMEPMRIPAHVGNPVAWLSEQLAHEMRERVRNGEATLREQNTAAALGIAPMPVAKEQQ